MHNLKKLKWKVEIVWECQIEDEFEKTSRNIIGFLNKNGVYGV